MALSLNLRKWILVTALSLIGVVVISVFWIVESEALVPTPIPKDYKGVVLHKKIDLDRVLALNNGKPTHFHFFSPNCSCSKFNLSHFNALLKEFSHDINFYFVVQDFEQIKEQELKEKLRVNDSPFRIIIDKKEALARSVGVYSTPQAALLTKDGTLYYRGNYNRARYCTKQNSNYVQLSMRSLLAGDDAPEFGHFATRSYGCALKENTSSLDFIFLE